MIDQKACKQASAHATNDTFVKEACTYKSKWKVHKDAFMQAWGRQPGRSKVCGEHVPDLGLARAKRCLRPKRAAARAIVGTHP